MFDLQKIADVIVSLLFLLSTKIGFCQGKEFPKFLKKDSLYTLGNKIIKDEYFQLESTTNISKKRHSAQKQFFDSYISDTFTNKVRFNKINNF